MKRSVKFVFCALGALALPGLVGCGGGGSSTTPITPVVPLPHSVSAALPNGLTATVAEDRTSVPVGGVVTYTMTLTNNTAQPITFQPVQKDTRPSAGVGDALMVVEVAGGEGGLVTFPTGGFAQVITTGPSNSLAPGKSVSGTVLVGPSGPGGFAADGSYTNPSGFLVTGAYIARVSFTLQTGQDASSVVTTSVGPLEVDAK